MLTTAYISPFSFRFHQCTTCIMQKNKLCGKKYIEIKENMIMYDQCMRISHDTRVHALWNMGVGGWGGIVHCYEDKCIGMKEEQPLVSMHMHGMLIKQYIHACMLMLSPSLSSLINIIITTFARVLAKTSSPRSQDQSFYYFGH